MPHRRRRSQPLPRLCGADRGRAQGHRGQAGTRAPYSGDAYTGKKLREVPKTLRDAIVALRKSKMLREALGDKVVEHYLHTAEWEQFEYDRRVTDWELKRGFERS
jgi:glutamine synthetase